jgi:hypothetical protein
MNSLMTARGSIIGLAIGVSLIAVSAVAFAQGQPATATADADYVAKMMTAAPQPIVRGATILAMDKTGAMRTVQKGTNDYTCMALGDGTPMCTDKNGWEWMTALMTKKAPPNKIGFMYMLAGDSGASNTDPFAAAATPQNHWVKTASHVMILGPTSAKAFGYPRTADADPTKPYVMWADTPYEHVMIPIK